MRIHRHLSEETKKKISAAKKNKPLSAEHKQKISAAKRGKKFTQEHKQKISDGMKAYWNTIPYTD